MKSFVSRYKLLNCFNGRALILVELFSRLSIVGVEHLKKYEVGNTIQLCKKGEMSNLNHRRVYTANSEVLFQLKYSGNCPNEI